MPVSDDQIRDRFVICLKEVLIHERLKDIAHIANTSESYLSQLQKKSRKIPPSLIANFCLSYGYSAHWILTGKGHKKGSSDKSPEEVLIEQNLALVRIIERLTK